MFDKSSKVEHCNDINSQKSTEIQQKVRLHVNFNKFFQSGHTVFTAWTCY